MKIDAPRQLKYHAPPREGARAGTSQGRQVAQDGPNAGTETLEGTGGAEVPPKYECGSFRVPEPASVRTVAAWVTSTPGGI